VAPPRLLADEMVGRLARYLRMMGADTVYVRGLADEEVLRIARAEERVLLTRDRELARRSGRAVLLSSPRIEDQVRETWAAVPTLSRELRFDRCTLCNGRLSPVETPGPADTIPGVPWGRVREGLVLYRCDGCRHLFWEGSHTEGVRRRLHAWSTESRP